MKNEQSEFFKSDYSERIRNLFIWYSRCFNFGSKTALRILHDFAGDIEAIYNAEKEEYNFKKYPRMTVSSECLCNKRLDEVHNIVYDCRRTGVEILTYADERFPQKLKSLSDCPLVLYCKGKIPENWDMFSFGAVGTRNATNEAAAFSYNLCKDLAKNGVTIVTGLAKGIDTAAVKGAMDSDSFAIGVIGVAANKVYPAENRYIYEYLNRNGLIISEIPPFGESNPKNFSLRNRIISGLSDYVGIFEANESSGSMITARYAKEQGKVVFAVPGFPSNPGFNGCNKLLREGARVLTCAQDVLSHTSAENYENISAYYDKDVNNNSLFSYEPENFAPEKKINDAELSRENEDILSLLSDNEKKVLSCFKNEPLECDELVIQGMPVSVVQSCLTMLEIKGFIICLPGGKYTKA